jgi:exodeoxyribonuclease V alpha subunit
MDSLQGTIERITFYNPENGYSVIRLAPDTPATLWDQLNDDGLVTVVGVLPDLSPGLAVSLRGSWDQHSTYGTQFKVETFHLIRPNSLEGIKRYLGSGIIKGVRERTAARIIDHFGEDTLRVLDEEPKRLYEVNGIGAGKIRQIIKGWAAQKEVQEVMLFLQGHGITSNLATKIHSLYGAESIHIVESDPYRLVRDIYGVGFKTADQIAQDLGLPADHPTRLEAGLAFMLEEAAGNGHMFLPEEDLLKGAAGLLGVTPEAIQPALARAEKAELIKQDSVTGADGTPLAVAYLPIYYYTEVGLAARVRRLIENPASRLTTLRTGVLSSIIADIAAETDVNLSPVQQGAIVTAVQNKVSILTGGPGTGKTTALRALIHLLDHGGATYALASPTGRAAKRLSEATGRPASTIHRLLGFSATEGFLSNEENPLNYDMLIIDETSMLDAILANALFRAIDPRSHVLLVGDIDQLPSVGAGDVLRDLIASDLIPVTRLDVIFRQEGHSAIVTNAHRINQGLMPHFPEEIGDFFLFKIGDDAVRAGELVVEVVKERIPSRFGLDALNDIQVLVPMYRGPAGVSALNDQLQAALNPGGRMAQRLMNGRMYRVGDKVLQTRNNYDKDVFNGDVGRIHQIDPGDQILTVIFDDRFVDYDFSEVSELIHAYAISVHRSQGSEYPVVVMPIIAQHYMLLQRNLLYTAITRARKMVVLIGSTKAIALAVNNDEVTRRNTALISRLREGAK